MSIIKTIDDLDVGDIVTIHSWKLLSRDLVGHALEIKAFALPFVAVFNHFNGVTYSLDSRIVNFMSLNDKFVEACNIKINPTTDCLINKEAFVFVSVKDK